MRQFANLDILRSLAVLYVYVCHIVLMVDPANRVANGLGRFGVILFFFHTAFVLQGSLSSGEVGTWRWAGAFYVRRAFRIYPLAILVVIIVVVSCCPFAPWDLKWAPSRSGLTILSNLALSQNLIGKPSVIVPLWSLPIEIQMYVLLPGIFLLMVHPRWKVRQVTLWIVASLAAFVVYRMTQHMNLLAFGGCFLSGILSYKLSRNRSPSCSPGFWISAIFGVTAIGMSFTLLIPVEWLCCFALAFVFPLARDCGTSWLTVPAHFIARYSYGIYLFHIFGLWIGFSLPVPQLAQILTGIAITAALSTAAYHWIESPLIAVGKVLATKLEKPEVRLGFKPIHS